MALRIGSPVNLALQNDGRIKPPGGFGIPGWGSRHVLRPSGARPMNAMGVLGGNERDGSL